LHDWKIKPQFHETVPFVIALNQRMAISLTRKDESGFLDSKIYLAAVFRGTISASVSLTRTFVIARERILRDIVPVT
jgi:hypothetical protein